MRKVESHEYAQGQRADRSALAEIADLIDEGAYDAASAAAWEVQRDTPGDPAVWLLLTRIDFRREQYAGAMYAARMATRLDPSSPDAWLWLARAAVTRARWRTEGMDAALQATALAPEDPQTWTVLAQLHLARGAYYEAAIAAERAVRVAPDHVDAHRMLGVIATQAEEWGHAVNAFRRVLALKPNDVEARAGLIKALQAQDIDPSHEMKRYGGLPRGHGDTDGPIRRLAKGLSDPGPLAARPAVVAMGALVCIALGAGLGVAVPAIGVVRGSVGATALVLMWLAMWPLRRPRRARAAPAGAGRASSPTAHVEPSPSDAVEPTPERSALDPPAEQVVADVPEEPVMASAKAESPAAERARGRSSTPAPARGTWAPARRRASRGPEPAAPERVERPQRPSTGGGDAQRQSKEGPDALPDDPRDLIELSQIRLAEFDLVGARAAAARLASLAPDSVEAHRALAAVSLAEQDYAQAELHYSKVLEMEPLDEEAHERLAMAKEGRRREQQRSQRHRRRRG